MRTYWLLILVSLPFSLLAQEGRPPQRPGREMLQQRVMERFVETYRQQAALTDEQLARFTESLRQTMERRREQMQHEREIWRALERQLRPGVAASADSLERLMSAIFASRAEQANRMKADYESYAEYLTPVQRALLLTSWERFQRRIRDVRDRPRPGRPRPQARQP